MLAAKIVLTIIRLATGAVDAHDPFSAVTVHRHKARSAQPSSNGSMSSQARSRITARLVSFTALRRVLRPLNVARWPAGLGRSHPRCRRPSAWPDQTGSAAEIIAPAPPGDIAALARRLDGVPVVLLTHER